MKTLIALLLVLASFPAIADRSASGDWRIDLSKNYSEAFVYNSTGESFGFWCNYEACFFYIRTANKCREGARAPLLYNSDAGAKAITGICFPATLKGQAETYITRIEDAALVNAVSEGDTIGFAIALKGGDFIAARFSLNGALEAIGRVSQSKIEPTRKQPSTLLSF